MTTADFTPGMRFTIKGRTYPNRLFVVREVTPNFIVCIDENDRHERHQFKLSFNNYNLRSYSERGLIEMLKPVDADAQITAADLTFAPVRKRR